MEPTWVTIENSFFDQDGVVDQGWMSLDDACQKVLADPNSLLGFTRQLGDDDSNCYCEIAKIGTAKYEDGSGSVACFVYKVSLPDEDLFEDDFSEGDWLRPGRGEGLADEAKELRLFAGVDPSDLLQGGLGDCWLISAMAALAEFPDQVMNLFDQKTISAEGKYQITLYSYEDGLAAKPIVLDDRFPVEGSSFKNIRMTHEGEIWSCLLEKAFAIYASGYGELDGGQSFWAFGALTGCKELYEFDRNDDDGSWSSFSAQFSSNKPHEWDGAGVPGDSLPDEDFVAALQDFDNQNFLMCCGSQSGSDTEKNDMGVVQGHAYSLVSVKTNVANSGYNLMCLRNPWGESEWTGDWSDHSDLWDANPEVAAACGHTEDDDGLFWISYEDFCENYKVIWVCKKDMGESRGKRALTMNQRAIADGTIADRRPKNKASLDKKRSAAPCTACAECAIM